MNKKIDDLINNIVNRLELECYEKNYATTNGDNIKIRVIEFSNLPKDKKLNDLIYNSLESSSHNEKFKKVRLIHGKIICSYTRIFEAKYVGATLDFNDKSALFTSNNTEEEEEFIKYKKTPLFVNLEIYNLKKRIKENLHFE